MEQKNNTKTKTYKTPAQSVPEESLENKGISNILTESCEHFAESLSGEIAGCIVEVFCAPNDNDVALDTLFAYLTISINRKIDYEKL